MPIGLTLIALAVVSAAALLTAQGARAAADGTQAAPFSLSPDEDAMEAAWYRLAALTVQVDAALEALRFEHRCRPFGSTPGTAEQQLFAVDAVQEALAAVRLMWPHVLSIRPSLADRYWPLRFRIGQIAQASDEERSELACRVDFHQIRNRWNLALAGAVPGLEPPFAWPALQRLGALRRIGAAYSRAVSTTCHSLDGPSAAVTSHPAQVTVLRQALSDARFTLRSVLTPRPRERGAQLLWEGADAALRDWRSGQLRSLEDGIRRDVCGHNVYFLLFGAYYTWLEEEYGNDAADRLDQLLEWTQLEVKLRRTCDFSDSPALPLVMYSIEGLVSPVRTIIPMPGEFRARRDEIADAVQAWLPDDDRVRALEVEALDCPAAQLELVSAFLTELGALPPMKTASETFLPSFPASPGFSFPALGQPSRMPAGAGMTDGRVLQRPITG